MISALPRFDPAGFVHVARLPAAPFPPGTFCDMPDLYVCDLLAQFFLEVWKLEIGQLGSKLTSLMHSYGALKLLPFWDSLRGDPLVEKIVAELAPK